MDSAYYTTAKQATHPTPGRASHKARNPKSLHKPNISIHFPVHASRHDSPVSARPLRHHRVQQAHRNRHGNNLHTDPGHLPHVSARQQKRRFPIIRATPQPRLAINSSIQAHIQVIVKHISEGDYLLNGHADLYGKPYDTQDALDLIFKWYGTVTRHTITRP